MSAKAKVDKPHMLVTPGLQLTLHRCFSVSISKVTARHRLRTYVLVNEALSVAAKTIQAIERISTAAASSNASAQSAVEVHRRWQCSGHVTTDSPHPVPTDSNLSIHCCCSNRFKVTLPREPVLLYWQW